MSDLPGILPPDAGRLERAARRYAIAVLARMWWPSMVGEALSGDDMVDWIPSVPSLDGVARAFAAAYSAAASEADARAWDGASDDAQAEPLRLLRARLALYLRWCERVERSGCLWRANSDDWYACASTDRLDPEDVANGWRWAVPLWTLAPAHDPAVAAAERRRGKRA